MTQKRTHEEPHTDLSTEDAIARYLERHPDFFIRRPDALARITLTHPIGERTVSLIERQVQVLREENRSLARQLKELVAIARENDLLAARLHRFALAMAESHTLDEVFDSAYEILTREFRIDAVRVLCQGEAPTPFQRTEFVGHDARLGDVLAQVKTGAPLCGVTLAESLMHYLFGDRAAEVRSSAVIALHGHTPRGVLCLGSHDPGRFHAGMGTVYLTKIGDIVMHSIARFS